MSHRVYRRLPNGRTVVISDALEVWFGDENGRPDSRACGFVTCDTEKQALVQAQYMADAFGGKTK